MTGAGEIIKIMTRALEALTSLELENVSCRRNAYVNSSAWPRLTRAPAFEFNAFDAAARSQEATRRMVAGLNRRAATARFRTKRQSFGASGP